MKPVYDKSSYSEKLRDPRWQKMRLEILSRDEWTCQQCFDKETTLHVHHRYYSRGKEPWEYEQDALVTLCESCHAEESEFLPNVIESTVLALKRHFFAQEILQIGASIWCLQLQHTAGVVASTISWVLDNPEIQRELIDRYFQSLKDEKATNE
jgi:hypothetical protein